MRKEKALIILGVFLLAGMFLFGCVEKEMEIIEAPVFSVADVLPASGEIEGWQLDETIASYDETTLSDVIDGAAEKYLSYGFQQAWFAKYTSGAEAIAQVQVFDMGETENAFGIYSTYDDVGRKRASEGIQGTMSDINMDCYRGKYFVRISVSGFDPVQSASAVKQFGSRIDQKLEGEAVVPEIAQLLPKGYITGTLKYFTNSKNLNQICYLGEDDPLMMDSGARGVVAAYSVEKKNTESGSRKVARDQVFLITYPDDGRELAQKAFKKCIDCFSRKKGYRIVGLFNPPRRVLIHKDNELESIVYMYNGHIFGAWNLKDAPKREEIIKGLTNNLKLSVMQ